MTQYFDDTHKQIREASTSTNFVAEIMQIEGRLVRDCTIAAMQPTFPADLRLLVHEIVLKYAVYMLPVNAPPRDFETDEEHVYLITGMCWDLHSVFHDLAYRDIVGFSDSPLLPLDMMYAQGEEEREKLVAGRP